MSLFKKISTVSTGILLCRITGFARDLVIANKLGTSHLADAFILAFKLPNLFRRFFAEGTMNFVFMPIYVSTLGIDKDRANILANSVLLLLLLVLSILVLIFQLFMPDVLSVIAPGLLQNTEKFDITIELARITFPYIILISVTSLLSAVLNAHNKFFTTSISPILLNISLILFALFMSPYTKTAVHSLAYAVIVAGTLQLIWTIIACYKIGFVIKFPKITCHKELREFSKKVVPTMIGAGTIQLSTFLDTLLATFFSGAVSTLYYADRINQLPLALIGTTLSIVTLPRLSKHFADNNFDDANQLTNHAIKIVLTLVTPSVAVLLSCNYDIIYILFFRGQFDLTSVQNTSVILAIYALALPAMVTNKIFVTILFATKNVNATLKISVISLLSNIFFSLLLTWHYGYLGLATATTISSYVQFCLLAHRLSTDKLMHLDKTVILYSICAIIASLVATASVYLIKKFILNDYLTSDINYLLFTVLMVFTMLIYFLVQTMLGNNPLQLASIGNKKNI